MHHPMNLRRSAESSNFGATPIIPTATIGSANANSRQEPFASSPSAAGGAGGGIRLAHLHRRAIDKRTTSSFDIDVAT